MAMVDNGEQQQSALHFCRVCKIGFGCGEALDGHMRRHAIADYDDEEPAPPSLLLDPQGGIGVTDSNKPHPYFLRTTANRFLSCKAHEANCILNESGSPVSWMANPKQVDQLDCEENWGSNEEEEDLANCLVLLSTGPFIFSSNKSEEGDSYRISANNNTTSNSKEIVVHGKPTFQCKACKKVFNSHQALGGHRASHKKVKGCYASGFDSLTDEDMLDEDLNVSDEFVLPISHKRVAPWELDDEPPKKKGTNKVHECSICYRTFSSGQALGGHKRCHWLASNNNILPNRKLEKPAEANSYPAIKRNNDHGNNPSKFETLTRMYLPTSTRANKEENLDQEVDEEHKKDEKLSILRDMDLDGGSSTWLQMGIASSTTY